MKWSKLTFRCAGEAYSPAQAWQRVGHFPLSALSLSSLSTKQMVCYVSEWKPNSCVVFSSCESLSSVDGLYTFWRGDYVVFFREAPHCTCSLSFRSIINAAFVWRVESVWHWANHSPYAVWFYSLGYYGNSLLAYQVKTITETGPLKANLHREMDGGLTANIQPGVARGHASFIDGRECVPTSIRLHHPLYQQALPARAVLIQTVENKQRFKRLHHQANTCWPDCPDAGEHSKEQTYVNKIKQQHTWPKKWHDA